MWTLEKTLLFCLCVCVVCFGLFFRQGLAMHLGWPFWSLLAAKILGRLHHTKEAGLYWGPAHLPLKAECTWRNGIDWVVFRGQPQSLSPVWLISWVRWSHQNNLDSGVTWENSHITPKDNLEAGSSNRKRLLNQPRALVWESVGRDGEDEVFVKILSRRNSRIRVCGSLE